jgi:hypothetical protein
MLDLNALAASDFTTHSSEAEKILTPPPEARSKNNLAKKKFLESASGHEGFFCLEFIF